jgi:acyl-CoA thioesterase-1
MEAIIDDPSLPRVLLIGDSISIGYTLPARAKLKGIANVHRPPTNCGPTTKGIIEIEKWLGKKKWDVIHFNWGLHDLKYMGPNDENLADPKANASQQQVPPADYEANLLKLVSRLKQTGAKLIWRNTTPVPAGCKGRVAGDSAKYNVIAARVMKKHGIETQDMFAFCEQNPKLQLPKNVHFTGKGSALLADQVVKSISAALKTVNQ